jgi:biotin carboxyl carrier protein
MTGPARETAVNLPVGETLSVPERLIVAPSTGVFRPLNSHGPVRDHVIKQGDVIGALQSLGVSTPIRSPFEGRLVALLVVEGERVRPGQPVAWMRVP